MQDWNSIKRTFLAAADRTRVFSAIYLLWRNISTTSKWRQINAAYPAAQPSTLVWSIAFSTTKIKNLTDARVLSEFNRPLPGRSFGVKVRYVFK